MTEPKRSILTPGEQREVLQAFRNRTGLTLVAFGKLCGLTNPMLSMFENGKRELSDEAWERVRHAMEKFVTKNRKQLGIKRGALHAALSRVGPDSALVELEHGKQALEREQRKLLALEAFLDNPEKYTAIGYDETARLYMATASVPPYKGRVDQESFDLEALNKRIDEKIRKFPETMREFRDERKRQVAELESLNIDAPIVSELIESFRREIAEKDALLEEMARALEEK